jgi:hypothetical protein
VRQWVVEFQLHVLNIPVNKPKFAMFAIPYLLLQLIAIKSFLKFWRNYLLMKLTPGLSTCVQSVLFSIHLSFSPSVSIFKIPSWAFKNFTLVKSKKLNKREQLISKFEEIMQLIIDFLFFLNFWVFTV